MIRDDVYTFNCPSPEFYTNSIFISSINLLLDIQLITPRTKGTEFDSAYGEVLTSVGDDYSDITKLPGSKHLVDWVTEHLKQVGKCSDIKYEKSWCNKMFKGSQGLVHAHTHPMFDEDPPDFVAIFYLNVPPDGSQLIFVEDGTFNSHYYDYDDSKLTYIKVETGQLIIHPPQIPHAVSIHNSEEPRICLVFEGKYIG